MKKKESSILTIYVVLNYKDSKGNSSNVALLRKKDAELWNEDGNGDGILEVQSEEIGWMKQAADAACWFDEMAMTGSLEVGTLSDRIKNYLNEVFHR